jgi:hypothetical protein
MKTLHRETASDPRTELAERTDLLAQEPAPTKRGDDALYFGVRSHDNSIVSS